MTGSRTAIGEQLGDAVRGEWTKFVSLRSTRLTLATFPVTAVGLAVLISVLTSAHWAHASAASRAAWDPTNNVLAGLVPGYLVIPVLGVLMMTSEYSHGSIRSTLAAVPRRSVVLAAKAVVLSAVAFVVCELVTFAAFLISQAVTGDAPRDTLGGPGVLRALVLSGAFLTLMGLFGLALGTVIRHSGGAVAAYAATVLVVPDLLLAVPGNLWRFGPITILANSITAVRVQPEFMSPWTGFAAMACYATATLAVAFLVFARRDA